MVFWPESISGEDPQWVQAAALMRVLPLDARNTGGRLPATFFEQARDFLSRPMIEVERRRVEAPYFEYSLRFTVSCSVHGRIPVDDHVQLAEFCRVVDQALHSPVARAERRRIITMQRQVLEDRNRDMEKSPYFNHRKLHALPELPDPDASEPTDSHVHYTAAVIQARSGGAVNSHVEALRLLVQKGLGMGESSGEQSSNNQPARERQSS